jgi:hypothetical protein
MLDMARRILPMCVDEDGDIRQDHRPDSTTSRIVAESSRSTPG